MMIGLCGYGYTGSGAVLDILKEYECFEVLENFELEIVYKPDGIETLEHFLMTSPSRFFGSDTAIRRFLVFCDCMKEYYDSDNHGKKFMELSNNYIQKLVQVSWKGSCSFHAVECDAITRRLKYGFMKKWGRRIKKYLNIRNMDRITDKTMYLSVQPENFYELSREYLNAIVNLKRKEIGKTLVLDQPFSGDNPYKSFPFFEDPYAIIVDKDPRDMYLLAKMSLGAKGSFIPSGNVDDFIVYYRAIMSYRDRCRKDLPNVLYLHFEDLIYDSENTRNRIEDFLGIHASERICSCFDKTKSINNTQLFLKYTQHEEDIRKIEMELKPWIYDFSKYDIKPSFDIGSF